MSFLDQSPYVVGSPIFNDRPGLSGSHMERLIWMQQNIILLKPNSIFKLYVVQQNLTVTAYQCILGRA